MEPQANRRTSGRRHRSALVAALLLAAWGWHATFFKSPDGTEDWMAYHANDQPTDVCDMGRTPRIQPVSWNPDGTPHFGAPVSTATPLAAPSGEG